MAGVDYAYDIRKVMDGVHCDKVSYECEWIIP